MGRTGLGKTAATMSQIEKAGWQHVLLTTTSSYLALSCTELMLTNIKEDFFHLEYWSNTIFLPSYFAICSCPLLN